MSQAFLSFDAYWGSLRDVSDDAVLAEMHAAGGLSISPEVFLERLSSDEGIKAALRENTEECIARGAFGSPAIYISAPGFDTEMHFGNDRMELVEAAVLKMQGKPWRWHETNGVVRASPGPAVLPRL